MRVLGIVHLPFGMKIPGRGLEQHSGARSVGADFFRPLQNLFPSGWTRQSDFAPLVAEGSQQAPHFSLGFREVVRKVSPKVVNVINYREIRPGELELFGKKQIFTDPEDGQQYLQFGSGSGVLIQNGVILTNYHVVRNCERLRVIFASGQALSMPVKDIAFDSLSDLAVLRLPNDLPKALLEETSQSVEFADSSKDVHVGDFALAVGSPLGLRQTVTQGVISAKGRLLPMLDLVDLLQTDAAINPGSSGGPLFDQKGRVVGINVAIATDNGGNQGIGFAVPSNTAKKIADQLLKNGEVPRGYLGIAMEDLPMNTAKDLNLEGGGILVKNVLPNEAAAKAGIAAGDVIVSINKNGLDRHQALRHFRQLVVQLEPNEEASIEVLRDGQRKVIATKVGKRPAKLP